MASTKHVALLLVDLYNDFLHPSGKLTPRVSDSLQNNGTIEHMCKAVDAARRENIPVFYGLHQQWRPDFYRDWRHMTDSNVRQSTVHFFAEGSWGAEIYEGLEPDTGNGDVVVSKHWNSNAFWNTDLEYQLRQRDITHLVLAGLTANTCLESTGRAASECGFHVTMLKDATAAFTIELQEVAMELISPLYANEVLTVDEWTRKFGRAENI